MTRRLIDPIETRWLTTMDDAYLNEISKEREAKREREADHDSKGRNK